MYANGYTHTYIRLANPARASVCRVKIRTNLYVLLPGRSVWFVWFVLELCSAHPGCAAGLSLGRPPPALPMPRSFPGPLPLVTSI